MHANFGILMLEFAKPAFKAQTIESSTNPKALDNLIKCKMAMLKVKYQILIHAKSWLFGCNFVKFVHCETLS